MTIRTLLAAALLAFPDAGQVDRDAQEAAAQDTGDYSASSDLRETLSLLREVHPALNRYVGDASLSETVDAESDRLDAIQDPSDIDLARSLHLVLSRLGDGHIALGLPSFQGSEPDRFLPLLPKWVGGKVFVDASEPELPPGTELLSIDGQTMATWMERLQALALVDGDRPALRRARVERRFTQHFHLEVPPRDAYTVEVRLPDGVESSLRLEGRGRDVVGSLRSKRISAPLWGEDPGSPPSLPQLTAVSESTRLLRLATFGSRDAEAYERRVDELFAELSGEPGIETLILDLRGNEGGLRTQGIAVLEHLIKGEYAQWTGVATRVRRVPERFRERVSFPFAPETALSRFPGKPEGRRVVFQGDPLAERMRGTRAPWEGTVIVFVDDGTNSAAVEMLVALLAHRDGVRVVGTETGGECGRHIGEIPIVYSTRDLGVQVLFSLAELTHVRVEGCRAGRGIEPGVLVDYDEEHFLSNRDPYLSALGY